MLGTVMSLIAGTSRLIYAADHPNSVGLWAIWIPFVDAFTWAYAAIRPIARPQVTAPYDLFVLYIMHFIAAAIGIGSMLYEHAAMGVDFPPTVILVLDAWQLVVPFGLAVVVMSMPVGIPTARVVKEDIVRNSPFSFGLCCH